MLFKYILKVNLIKTRKKKEKNIDKSTSIKRLSSPILTKLPKEVKEISKYFKTISLAQENKNTSKLYAQALQLENNTREVFKIKKAFPSL